jgi:hypothetical protein
VGQNHAEVGLCFDLIKVDALCFGHGTYSRLELSW